MQQVEVQSYLFELYNTSPQLFNFLGILLLGRIGGMLVKATLLRVFKITGFDETAKKSKVQLLFEEIGYRGTVLTLMADIAKWFVYILALSSAFEILGLREVAALFSSLVFLLPIMIISVIIIIIGLFISDLFGKLVYDLVKGKDDIGEFASFAVIASTFTRIMFSIITVIIALNFMGIDPTSITVFLAFLLLTTAGLIMLGLTDLAPNFMGGVYIKNMSLKEGDEISLNGTKGKIINMGTFSTTIRPSKESKKITVPNRDFIRYSFSKKQEVSPQAS